MKIVVTAREIMDAPLISSWDHFCDRQGINPWCINEGLMDDDETFELTEEEARFYGLLGEPK